MKFSSHQIVGISYTTVQTNPPRDMIKADINEETSLWLYYEEPTKLWVVQMTCDRYDERMLPFKGDWDEAVVAMLAVVRAVTYGLDPRAAQYAATLSFAQMQVFTEHIAEAEQHVLRNTPDAELRQRGYEATEDPSVWTHRIKILDPA